jgi:tRNA pseudouridine38-40 synthase
MEQDELPLGIGRPESGVAGSSQEAAEKVSVSIAAGPTVRLRLLIGYLGTDFHGLAPQPGLRTVIGQLGEALAKIVGLAEAPHFGMSGRTDAGVHGWGQVLHVDIPIRPGALPPDSPEALRPGALPPDSPEAHRNPRKGLNVVRMAKSLNSMLGTEIAIRELDVVPKEFHARYSAKSRSYRYTIVNRPLPDPFLTRTAWHVPEPLDVRLLRLACDPFLGEHDFTSFCRAPIVSDGEAPRSLIRLITFADWVELGDGILRLDITGQSFCQQMVRSIVAMMVEIGRGRRTAGDVIPMLLSKDRTYAPRVAPAHGLCLWEVGY